MLQHLIVMGTCKGYTDSQNLRRRSVAVNGVSNTASVLDAISFARGVHVDRNKGR
jgi:hypothetical protein